MGVRVIQTLIAGCLLVLCAGASPANAAFPGQNGKIAFDNRTSPATVWTMNPDGTGQVPLRPGSQPSWSADGQALLFVQEDDIRRMPADGSSEVSLLNASGFPVCCSGVSWQTPAWSPDGTRIVASFINGEEHDNFYLELYTASAADGSNQQLIAAGQSPTWRPDGSRIAFSKHTSNGNSGPLHSVQPDGTGEQTVIEDVDQSRPDYSPDGTKIVYSTFAEGQTREIFVIGAPGSQPTRLTNNSSNDTEPVWSPDGTKIAFASDRDGNYEIYTMNADGTNQTRRTNNPGHEFHPSWQPTFGSGYPRPKGATPVRVSLVPAYRQCTSPDRTHGPPLAFGSCSAPVQESGELTVGDAPANMSGFVRYETVLGNPATPADEADIGLRVQITDVRAQGTLADYAGEVEAQATARLTDRTASAGDPATATNILFPLTTPCTPIADPAAGSTCSLTTTLDTLIPGAIEEGQRSVMQLSQVQVIDGGADGDTGTAPNTIFLRQGIFVP